MQEVLNESPYNDNYDIQRMQVVLSNKGIIAGIRRITRVMWENGWLYAPRRRLHGLKKTTTEMQEKENLIKKDFSTGASFTKLLRDISQVSCP